MALTVQRLLTRWTPRKGVEVLTTQRGQHQNRTLNLLIGRTAKHPEGDPGKWRVAAERMKEYERETAGQSTFDVSRPVLMRLDGHCFSTLTKDCQKPCDRRIHHAMVRAAHALAAEYNPLLTYTQSDEITLVFPAFSVPFDSSLPSSIPFISDSPIHHPTSSSCSSLSSSSLSLSSSSSFSSINDISTIDSTNSTTTTCNSSSSSVSSTTNNRLEEENDQQNPNLLDSNDENKETNKKTPQPKKNNVPYGGKIQKFVSLSSGLVSTVFSMELGQKGYFDARVFNVPDYSEAALNILWRASDARRNGRSALGQYFYRQSQLNRINSGDVVEKVKEEYGIDYDRDIPAWFRTGTLIKPCVRWHNGFNPITKEATKVVRSYLGCCDLETVAQWGSQVGLELDQVITTTFPINLEHPFTPIDTYLAQPWDGLKIPGYKSQKKIKE